MQVRDRKRRRRDPTREEQPAWRRQERTVALLEAFLDPQARVEHNVDLPVLLSVGKRKRQCDVVIRSGEFPREFVTIVEVQKRSRPAGLKELADWLKKMERVGAHALVCVSQKGFTAGAIEEADRHGARVKLLTLDPERTAAAPPPVIMSRYLWKRSSSFKILSTGTMHTKKAEGEDAKQGTVPVSGDDAFLFVGDESDPCTLIQLLARVLDSNTIEPRPKVNVAVDLGALDHPVWVSIDGRRRLLKQWEFKLEVTSIFESEPMEVSTAAYEQHGVHDPLAWVTRVSPAGVPNDLTIAIRREPGDIKLLFVSEPKAHPK
jgi:hypothetical protein